MNTDKRKVSVIVPIFNVEQYLPECVDSLISQTYNNIEIILVNDGSIDRCDKICDEYAAKDPRISVIHQENGGVTSARRAGAKYAKGEWLAFVDGDDTLPLNAIELLLNSSNGFECVRGTFYTNKKLQFSSHELSVLPGELCIKYILSSLFLPTVCGGIYKKSVFDADTIFDIPFYIKCGEDGLSLIKIVLNLEKIKYIDEVIYNYRKRLDSVTHKFIPTHDYILKYDDCLMRIFREKDLKKIYDKELLKFRISELNRLMSSSTMKMRCEYVKRIRTDHSDTPKSIGQYTTLLIAEFPYWLRKPLYSAYSKVNNVVYKLKNRNP